MAAKPVFLLCTALFLVAPTAEAAESFDGCAGYIDALPAAITTQGVWCLRKDLSTAIATGAAIDVNANNVTIDCNHFKLGGLAAGIETQTSGVTSGQSNTVVRQCNVRGFLIGINLDSSDGAAIVDNLLEGNTYVGIRISGDDGVVRGNRVADTGRNPGGSGTAIGIWAGGNVDVLDNTIGGVVAPDTAMGILASGRIVIGHNRVRSIVSDFESFGVVSQGTSFPGTIHDNAIHGPGTGGIRCGGDNTTSAHNFVTGFVASVSGCYESGNVVNPL